jgi:hypothetical protein
MTNSSLPRTPLHNPEGRDLAAAGGPRLISHVSVLENLEMSAFQRKDHAMCTIGRALMAQPKLLKLDEPRWVLRRSS